MKRSLSLFLVFFIFIGSLAAEEGFNPAYLYLTWQRSPETTMTIQWLTPLDNKENLVEFKPANQGAWQSSEGALSFMPYLPYYIHRIELTNLQPNTDYHFRIGKEGKLFKFRTMPQKADQPIRFVVGGDMYHKKSDYHILTKTNLQAARTDPYFALIGGDIAYSDAKKKESKPENATRWLEWLVAWKEQMVTSDGRLIPIVPAIGNHETKGHFDKTPEQAKCFYALFPLPGIQGCNVLDFGDYMSLFLLDSGHTHPIEGEQTSWLYYALEDRVKVPHKFAAYHVPAFPSYGSFYGTISSKIRKSWVPIFDLFGLHAAFEHHCHTYKRSHPLLHGRVNPRGVLYLGDGAWGVDRTRKVKVPKNTWYLANSASKRHFILVTLLDKNRHFEAIDQQGQVFDEYSQ